MANLTSTPRNFDSALSALAGRSERKIGNNTWLTKAADDCIYATLHGNAIVKYTPEATYGTWAGWASNTTRDRLNQLTGGRWNISKGRGCFNGEPVENHRDWITA